MVVRDAFEAVAGLFVDELGAVGILVLVVVLGLPIIGVLSILGVVLKGAGVPTGVQEAVGLVVGFGLLALVMAGFWRVAVD